MSTLTSKQILCAAIPSFAPVKPRPSSVVAFTFILSVDVFNRSYKVLLEDNEIITVEVEDEN